MTTDQPDLGSARAALREALTFTDRRETPDHHVVILNTHYNPEMSPLSLGELRALAAEPEARNVPACAKWTRISDDVASPCIQPRSHTGDCHPEVHAAPAAPMTPSALKAAVDRIAAKECVTNGGITARQARLVLAALAASPAPTEGNRP